MPRFRSRLLPAVLLAWLVQGCTTPPAAPSFAPISFAHLTPIALDVARIEVDERYAPPLKPPNVEHTFPVAPAEAAKLWAQERLTAGGRAGIARVIIEEASVISEKLKTTGGIKGAFTRESAERLVATLTVRVEVETAGGLGTGFAEATASRRRTLLEGVTLNERERAYHEITQDLMREFDSQAEASIRQHLAPFLR